MMPDREKVIKGLRDIDMFIAGRLGYEKAKNFLRTIDETIILLKEQEAVVRCKDCKKRYTVLCIQEEAGNINNQDEWFCADGERK